MKIKSFICAAIASAVFVNNSVCASDAFPKLQGPWLGQPTPSTTPEVFAPGLISLNGRYEFGISFSPNLDELYFTALETGEESNPTIFYSKIENGYWSKPKEARFSQGKLVYELLPFVSTEENKLYFTGRLNQSQDSSGIWYVKRQPGGWSEAKTLDVTPEKGRLSDFNQRKDGDVFFTNMPERKMYTAKNTNGQLSDPVPLDIEFGLHGFISPKQDYLLVNGRKHKDSNRRDNDLFVYFKNEDGTWSQPINLGSKINTTYSETVARVSPDGKYLFFGRYNEPDKVSNIYWVSTDVIHELKSAYFNH